MKQKLSVMVVFGTRPEAVKLAPVIQALQSQSNKIDTSICITAQHREMLDQVLSVFKIVPDYDLDLMRPGQNLAQLTAKIFTDLDPVVKEVQPDWLLIQGDTTTVMASALLGYYHHIKVGHVEAGLRTFDKWQPFPEEINRRVASVVADLHFAPTENNRRNLLREGISNDSIKVTGNPAIDALHIVAEQPEPAQVKELLDLTDITSKLRRLILVTAHRRESFGKPIQDICTALIQLAEHYHDTISLIYPVHLNPNIQEPVYENLSGVDNIHLIQPLDYVSLVHLMKHAALILTDSGGIQEEAPSLGVPTLVLRDRTERQEGITAGTLKLVGTKTARIFTTSQELLDNSEAYAAMAGSINPYGDGHAAARIVNALLESWEQDQ